ncbi:MAG: hypothetical protein AAF304_03635 [Pseudomonadota bacterium]
MKEFTIDACRWYLHEEMDDASRIEAIENFRMRYEPLLGFLNESNLYTSQLPKTIEEWHSLEIKFSDFTDEGLELVMNCHDQWLESMEKGVSPTNIKLWERELYKIRQDPNESLIQALN